MPLLWLMVVGFLIAGVLLGLHLPVMSYVLTKYMSIAVLAALDSVFGGIRAYQEDHFDTLIFLSGFIANTLLAAGLAYMGDILRIELYMAAVVAFGVRIFQNLAIIRRYLLKKY